MTPIGKMFGGKREIEKECLTCKRVNVKEDRFLTLDLYFSEKIQ